MICGSHSRHVRCTTRDSIMLSIYESRLLSCPTYFWYSSIGGTGCPCGAASRARHQFTTMSCPSGLIDGQRKNTVLSRMAFISGSLACASSSYATCGVCCEPAISDAWSPPLMSTKARPSRASLRASASVRPSGWARRWLISRSLSSRARFAGEEMIAAVHGFPNDVLPTLISFTRLVAAASFLK